ncbi:hypothetical protein PLICRDRAFT_38955 [Plicaturopsis crispa FD-325 SS-3]|nr:hypothetical protein PLICRDRAFT_38955 [Plicaturopsis crispa FD-325 SS-3]
MDQWPPSSNSSHSIGLFAWQIIGITILWFDIAITFSDEVRLIWRRPKSISTVLFFANRYLVALTNFALLPGLLITWNSVSGCQTFQWFRHAILCVSHVTVMIILILRTYAIYGCNRKILAVLSGFALGIGVFLVYFLSVNGKTLARLLNSEDWQLPPSLDDQRTNGFVCIAEGAITPVSIAAMLFVFDLLVLVLTVYKTYGTAKEVRSLSGRLPLVTLILRDGSLYFLLMALAYLVNMTPFDSVLLMHDNISDLRRASPVSRSEGYLSGSFSVFANCLSVTLVSRFMLNLHEAAHTGVLSTRADESASIVSGIVFRDIHAHRPPYRADGELQLGP